MTTHRRLGLAMIRNVATRSWIIRHGTYTVYEGAGNKGQVMNDCLAHLLETGRVEFTSAGYNWVGGAFYV